MAGDDAGEGKRSRRDREKEEENAVDRSRKRRRSSYPLPDSSGSSESSSSGSGNESSSSSSGGRRRSSRRDKRRKDVEKERKRREKKRRLKEEKRRDEKKRRKKEKAERHKTGPVTASWGKYGLIKEVDMWTKRPEFIAWLAEVKKVNMETLPAWEEKQMFKEYMEDYNTATFPSKKYYSLDKYFHQKLIRRAKKGMKSRPEAAERTVFNDEEQRRQEMRMQRETQKEAEIDVLRRSMMGTGMAQAMKEQAQLREDMQYQYRVGNLEAANAIQRRLDPSVDSS